MQNFYSAALRNFLCVNCWVYRLVPGISSRVSRTLTKPLSLVWSSLGRLPSSAGENRWGWFSVPGNQVIIHLLLCFQSIISTNTLSKRTLHNPVKTETELQLQIGGRLVIANQLDQSNYLEANPPQSSKN
jgi:hypothetical protein